MPELFINLSNSDIEYEYINDSMEFEGSTLEKDKNVLNIEGIFTAKFRYKTKVTVNIEKII